MRYRSAWENVEQVERLIAAGLTHGHDRYPRLKLKRGELDAEIYKCRVVCPELGGSSSGLRYVYERVTIAGEECAIGLTVYVHQQRGDEPDVIKRIRKRFASYEPTEEGIRKLERGATD